MGASAAGGAGVRTSRLGGERPLVRCRVIVNAWLCGGCKDRVRRAGLPVQSEGAGVCLFWSGRPWSIQAPLVL